VRLILLLICFVVSLPVAADTSLWKVSKPGSHLFIGGTVHVLSAADYPLPDEFEQAYQQSSKLVFETDISAVASIEFQQQMMAAMIYTDGRTLRSELKPATYSELEKYCQTAQFPLESIQSLKPGMASMLLTVYELSRLGMAESGVDTYFHRKALNDAKALGQLETAQQQLEFIVDMGAGQEDELILSTIRDMRELPAMMTELKAAWREGDTAGLVSLGLEPMQEDFPSIYNALLVDRNRAWLPQIDAMLQTAETELVLVGALHLVGEDGLLAELARKGYTVQPY
jgi:uncharacterized protein YbaP (TraB family)